jgi:hypothetical protein
VAYIYVQTTKGVNVYDATAAGKLTLVKGSPFKTSGQMEGVNGKYLLSVGTTDIRSYAIASNGAVGKQASSTNTQNYSGSECGDTSNPANQGYPNGAVLDHTGKYFYVQLYGSDVGNCAAWQSYEVQPNGELSFLTSFEGGGYGYGNALESGVPTISGNDEFGYGVVPSEYSLSAFFALNKTKSGELEPDSVYSEVDPVGDPNGPYGPWSFAPLMVKADPTGHLAVLMVSVNYSDPPGGYTGPIQLASYTINDTTGGIASTNTWENMPTPDVPVSLSWCILECAMSMSPSGKVLALAGYPGLQLFHFNGAAPITTYSSLLLPIVNIDQLAWDNDNHLYALSYSSGKLYVYTATPTGISEAAGSPYKIENAYGISGLIVVPKL